MRFKKRMVKLGCFICSLGLLALWFAGIRSPDATVWYTWVIGLGAIAGFAVTSIVHASAPKRIAAGAPAILALALFVLWIIGLGTHATAWMVWWDFLFACGFGMFALAAAIEQGPVVRVPARDRQALAHGYELDPYDYYGPHNLAGFGYQLRGGYQGIGPKDYHRADELIADEVSARMTRHAELDASDIEVGVQDGDVTLRGSVDSRRSKRLAEMICDSVAGVRDVHNQLTLRAPKPSPGKAA